MPADGTQVRGRRLLPTGHPLPLAPPPRRRQSVWTLARHSWADLIDALGSGQARGRAAGGGADGAGADGVGPPPALPRPRRPHRRPPRRRPSQGLPRPPPHTHTRTPAPPPRPPPYLPLPQPRPRVCVGRVSWPVQAFAGTTDTQTSGPTRTISGFCPCYSHSCRPHFYISARI